MVEYPGWLLLLFLLSCFYGYTQSRTQGVLLRTAASPHWFLSMVITALVCPSWVIFGYPLPLYFMIIYLCRALRQFLGRKATLQGGFLLHLSFVQFLTLHLLLTAIVALFQGTTLHALQVTLHGRMVISSTVLFLLLLQDCVKIWRPAFANMFVLSMGSEETERFWSFLLFSIFYLMMDSLLCVVELEPLYPPLFLMGSCLVVALTLIRFLLHINILLKNRYIIEEHDRLASQLQAAEENVHALRRLAQQDVLTGAYSRRFALEHISTLLEVSIPFSLVFIDLDGLKHYNDTYGHDAGDAYLVDFVQALEGLLREGDLLSRVGGDEFVVLLPHCTPETASKRFAEIRTQMRQPREGKRSFPFSYGVAAPSPSAMDADALLQEADKAMYQDKLHHDKKGGETSNAS